jgi:alpha-ketoglutaric semialdehyde dehydrogenase
VLAPRSLRYWQDRFGMQNLELRGCSLIGAKTGSRTPDRFRAVNPATGQELEPDFYSGSAAEIDAAANLAGAAFASFSRTRPRDRARFLRSIADNIEAIRNEVVARAHLETALPQTRLEGETARTCGQLRLFAALIEEGSWVSPRIDRAQPDRKPLAKPDIRSMLRPIGPVLVFGASNFPLAFSVAGGDTASALAAGNPVIVKAHPVHPGTSELVGRAIQKAIADCGLHEGVFSLIFDRGTEAALALVKHPAVKAAGFTGSHRAGRALMDAAAARPEPIPFFAEMSSTNPLFILPGALLQRGSEIASGLFSSFTLGAGQFCTKPGMVFVPAGREADAFAAKLAELTAAAAPFALLTSGIQKSYCAAIEARQKKSGLKLLARRDAPEVQAGPALFETDAGSFLKDPELSEEVFGPATLIVHHSEREQALEIARKLEGHLTATIHGTERDLREFADLIAILETKAGRLIFNGFPTGVEVTHAMVHGGPYPATSDSRFTSVGTQAIFRFARPVCYQGFPGSALPDELKDENPLGIWRMVDGEMTRQPLAAGQATAAR